MSMICWNRLRWSKSSLWDCHCLIRLLRKLFDLHAKSRTIEYWPWSMKYTPMWQIYKSTFIIKIINAKKETNKKIFRDLYLFHTRFFFSYTQLTNDRWLVLYNSPVNDTLLISFSVINIIEAVSLTGSANDNDDVTNW